MDSVKLTIFIIMGKRLKKYKHVYSNTPADFDFKLESLAQGFNSLSEFVEHLATSVDIVFPVIHGRFGEDGGIQELLEKSNVPFVGTKSNKCRMAFDKGSEQEETELLTLFTKNNLDVKQGKVVVKPTRAGSSIGVTVAYTVADSLTKANAIISESSVLHSQPKSTVGTLAYIAPKVLLKKEYDGKVMTIVAVVVGRAPPNLARDSINGCFML